jgi:hypothetical protein
MTICEKDTYYIDQTDKGRYFCADIILFKHHLI